MDYRAERIRHPLRFRLLKVVSVENITSHLTRVSLGGDALAGFTSLGFDDHVKLFFPDHAGNISMPTLAEDGSLIWPEGKKPIMRDYTPRRFDPITQTLEIDFVLHLAGPATRWAQNAQVDQYLGVGGPKSSSIIPSVFDWYLLIGDDTALPAIARRLSELPKTSRVHVLVEVEDVNDHILFESAADVSVTWVHRKESENEHPLVEALSEMNMPTGIFHAWIACEVAQAKALRTYLIEICKANPKWIRAAAYWQRGSADTHALLDD